MDRKLVRSRQQERDTAKAYRGSRTVGSGNRWYSKGDVRAEDFLIENKRTDKKSYSIKLMEWRKIRSEALAQGRMPLMRIEIDGVSLVVMSDDDFQAGLDPA